jgi:hypothetical protein
MVVNAFLRYLETRGEGAVVRPWVWIAYLFFGPAIGTIVFQWYIFITVSSRWNIGAVSHAYLFLYLTFQTGNLVRVSAIVTQLIFEHALRIRVKAESPSSTRTTPAVTPETRSEMPTPDNVSVADDNAPETAGGSGEENGQSTTSSGIKGKQKEEFPSGLISDDDSEDPGKASNLVGKMNNLVSTDLENIVEGRDVLLLGPSFVSHLSQIPQMTLPTARSFIHSPSACPMRLVFIQHPWLECICRVRCDGHPLSYSRPPRKQNPEGPKRDHETGKFAVWTFYASGVDPETDRCARPGRH